MNRREFLTGAALAAASTMWAEQAKTPAQVAAKKKETRPEVPEVMAKLHPNRLISVDPHVQLLGSDVFAVVWMTREKANGWVDWSQDGGQTWKRAWNQRDGLLVDAYDTVHKITVRGYDPTRPLQYRVTSRAFTNFGPYKVAYSGEEDTRLGKLNALLPADGSFSFAMFNDVHNNLSLYPALAKQMTGLSFTVFVGDIMSHVDDEPGVQRDLLAPLSYCAEHTQAPMWYLRGNHETRGCFARHLRDYIAQQNGHFYGALTFGSARIVFVDTGEDKTDDHIEYSGMVDFESYLVEQTEWLAREVASDEWKKAKFRIAIMHIPPHTRLPNGKVWQQPLARINKLQALLDTAGTTLVLGAHLHRHSMDATKQLHPYALVVGGGCTARDATLTRCDVKGGHLTVRQYTVSGEECDRIVL